MEEKNKHLKSQHLVNSLVGKESEWDLVSGLKFISVIYLACNFKQITNLL